MSHKLVLAFATECCFYYSPVCITCFICSASFSQNLARCRHADAMVAGGVLQACVMAVWVELSQEGKCVPAASFVPSGGVKI